MWNVIHSKTLPCVIRRFEAAESCPKGKNEGMVQVEVCGVQLGGLLLHVANDAVGPDQRVENRQDVAAVFDHTRKYIS